MVKFPLKFETAATSSSGIGTVWNAKAGNLPAIPSCIPPEFGGPGGGYSPEDLFAISILNCLIATFKVYAEKGGVVYGEIHGRAVVTADKSPPSFAMTHVEIFFEIGGAQNQEKAKATLEGAIRDCAVSNSIKSGKTFHIHFI
jgi:organic hydroperoxide reductase OsmC/OhrA